MTRSSPEAALGDLVSKAVVDGRVSAAVGAAGDHEGAEIVVVAGRTHLNSTRRVAKTSRFDLASLTKPFTATLALALARRNLVPLELSLGEVWGKGVHPKLAEVSLESLLRHRSGLEAWTPLYRRLRKPQRVADFLLEGRALASRRQRYSDLGYILWGLSAERVLGVRLDRLIQRHVARPLGLRGCGYRPSGTGSVVETRLGNEVEIALAEGQGIAVGKRSGARLGAPQDGNAAFLSGVAGHAGLFGSALHAYRLGREWLRPERVLSGSCRKRALGGSGAYALGWRRPTRRGSAGPALGPSSFGHVGFTGGSLWIDPDADRILVLLAHRSDTAVDLAAWRRRFHKLATSR